LGVWANHLQLDLEGLHDTVERGVQHQISAATILSADVGLSDSHGPPGDGPHHVEGRLGGGEDARPAKRHHVDRGGLLDQGGLRVADPACGAVCAHEEVQVFLKEL
jgi:hypothetical protein